ncbi:MAG TPA: hypothetical protein VKV23_05920 [Acidimicrobiales bacterium]|nr:hypothetical protein [Acidimicrobiales bacterium]
MTRGDATGRSGSVTFAAITGREEAIPLRVLAERAGQRVFSVTLAPGERLEQEADGHLVIVALSGRLALEIASERRVLSLGQCAAIDDEVAYALEGAGSAPNVALGVAHRCRGRRSPGPGVVDLIEVARGASGRGVLWALEESADLNVNLARLEAGDEVGSHVNDDVDVLLLGLEGEGTIESAAGRARLGPLQLVHVPRGAPRRLVADEPFSYLSLHRRRTGLSIRSARHRA